MSDDVTYGAWRERFFCNGCDRSMSYTVGFTWGGYYHPCSECGGKFRGKACRPVYRTGTKRRFFGLLRPKMMFDRWEKRNS